MKKLSLPQLLVLNAYWVGLSFMWNALHPIILPAILLNYVPDAQKNTYLGLMTFVGLMIAMVVQPISGALSDGWVSKWGRRRPLMVIGTLLDFVFLVIVGLGWRVVLAVRRLYRTAVQFQHRARPGAGLVARRGAGGAIGGGQCLEDLHGHVQPDHRFAGGGTAARPGDA